MIPPDDKEIIFKYIEGEMNGTDFLDWILATRWLPADLYKPEYEKDLMKTKYPHIHDTEFCIKLFNLDSTLHNEYSKYMIKNIKPLEISQSMVKLLEYYFNIINLKTFSNYFDSNIDEFFSETGNDLSLEIFDSINKLSNVYLKNLIKEKFQDLLNNENTKRYFYTKLFKIYLAEIIKGSDEDIIKYCRNLAVLHYETYIVPIIYSGYDSELDTPENIKYYKKDIITLSKEFLSYIEKIGL